MQADDLKSAPRAPVHAAMTQFRVEGAELMVGDVPLTVLAARVGQTPFYAYDRALLRKRVGDLRSVLPQSVKLHYAMKANPMPALVGLMATLVEGVDVASAGELQVALDAGACASEISFADRASGSPNCAKRSRHGSWSTSNRFAKCVCLNVPRRTWGFPPALRFASIPTSS